MVKARDDQREVNNLPKLNKPQKQDHMMIIDEAKAACELVAVAKMLTAEQGDNVIAEAISGKVQAVGRGPQGRKENTNFLIVCEHGDWSGFMRMDQAIAHLNVLAKRSPNKYFAVVER